MTYEEAQIQKFALEQLDKWNLHGWEFRWTNARKQAGVCVFTPNVLQANQIGISRYLLRIRGVQETKDTVLHEVAHALSGSEAGHGRVWKMWANRAGARPERCYVLTETQNAEIDFKYHWKCNTCDYKVGVTRVSKTPTKYVRICPNCVKSWYTKPQVLQYKLKLVQNY